MLGDLQGIVVDVRTDNKTLRVRILHIHGLPDADATASDKNRTLDKYLPYIPYDIPAGVSPSEITGTGGYEVGAVVRITCADGTLDSARVTGIIHTAQEMKSSALGNWWTRAIKGITSLFAENDNYTDAMNQDQPVTTGGDPASSVPNADPQFKDYFGLPYSADTNFSLTSAYGPRWGAFHWGVDLCAYHGAPIYAVGDGTVVQMFSSWNDAPGYDENSAISYGNYVTIKHGTAPDGHIYYTRYAHLNAVNVKLGQEVKGTQSGHQGTQIGIQGNRGNVKPRPDPYDPNDTRGTHLHFEVLRDSLNHVKETYNNPENYIQFREATTAATGSYGENARKLWAFGLACGMSEHQCAGMLGNINTESMRMDPTSVEGIYDEPFQIGARKSQLFNGNSYVQPAMNDYALTLPQVYGSVELDWPSYIYDDSDIDPRTGEPYIAAGLGLIGFTGSWAKAVLDDATANGQPWYDLDTQTYTMVHYHPGRFDDGFLSYTPGRDSVYEACAAWFSYMEFGLSYVTYTGIGMQDRQDHAQYWYNELHGTTPSSEDEAWAEQIVQRLGL